MKKCLLVGMIALFLPACTLLETKEVAKQPQHKYTCEEIVASAERLRARGIDIQVNMQCRSGKRGYTTR